MFRANLDFPRTIPFDLYVFWRNYQNPVVDQLSTEEFFQTQMFRFTSELLIQKDDRSGGTSNLLLFSPAASMAARAFIQGYRGPTFDYIPVMHPQGYPYSFNVDYKNHHGNGPSALYQGHPNHQFYLLVNNSFEEWLKEHNRKLKEGLYEIEQNGDIRMTLDTNLIYKEYIQTNLYHGCKNTILESAKLPIHPEYPQTSCTIMKGICVKMQCKLDFLRSIVKKVPGSVAVDKTNELFWVINF